MNYFLTFSFQCGSEYHAPTGCETIKRWLTKCADDSETANYISAHTKDVSYIVLPLRVIYLINTLFITVPKMQYLHREEWWMQPYAVLQLQTRFLLDVSW
jgi:hypothetical protein